MKRAVLVVFATLIVLGCEPRVLVPPPDRAADPGAATAVLPINIGDVEAQVHLYCDVPAALEAQPNVSVTRLQTRKYDPGMITVDLYPPYPNSLMISCSMNNKLTNRNAIVAMRGSISVDDTPIRTFEMFVDRDTETELLLAEADVLGGLESPPETMLVIATAKVVLLPEGTDTSQINLETVEGSFETQSTLLSNPVRINFLPPTDSP
jgi:hypothetical protein